MVNNSKNQSLTKLKLAEKIQHEISSYLRKELLNPKTQFVSIVKVDLNKDNSVAVVHWDTFNSKLKDDISESLDLMVGKIRKLLAQNLQLRHTPVIRLNYFSQFEDEYRIQQLLNDNKSQNDE